MKPQMKIATCCYCGKRTQLVLSARGGHELACGACGAPLHKLKALKVEKAPIQSVIPMAPKSKRKAPKKRKVKKHPLLRFAKKAFDLIEDIID